MQCTRKGDTSATSGIVYYSKFLQIFPYNNLHKVIERMSNVSDRMHLNFLMFD